jgi:predicted transcriptional regulator
VAARKGGSQSNALPRLGELELALMEMLWQQPGQSAISLQQRLPTARRSSLSTIQSTLERLHRKSLVQRSKQGHAYVYSAGLARAELLGRLLGGVIRQLHTGSLDPILSSFVDFAERMDERTLDRLDELVQKRRQARLAREGEC